MSHSIGDPNCKCYSCLNRAPIIFCEISKEIMSLYKEITVVKKIIDGPALRVRRKAIGISAGKLAKEIGVSTVYLCDIERGNRNCSGKVAEKIVERIEFYERNGYNKK